MNTGERRELELAMLYNASAIYSNESGLIFPDFITGDGMKVQCKCTNGTIQLLEGMEGITLIEALQWYIDNVASDYMLLAWEGKRRGKEHCIIPMSELINYNDLFRLTWSSSGKRAIQFIGGANKSGKRLYNRIKKG